MDMILFSGQSNMEGETESCPEDRTPVEGAMEYKFLCRSFVPLCHPAGEDIPPYFNGANYGHGSLMPDFCRFYHRVSGQQVVAVHCAMGATVIDQWLPGQELYVQMCKKYRAALEDAKETPERRFFVWLQGESDAIRGLSISEYLQKLMVLKNTLKADLSIDRFGIIRVGYFVGGEADEAIMEAQEQAVLRDPDFVMLTRATAPMSTAPEFLFAEDHGHFNNKGLYWIGRLAGEALARCR